MEELPRVSNASLKDIMRSENSSDDVQVLDTMPSKTQKSTIHSLNYAQKQPKPLEVIGDGPDLEIVRGTFNKSPISYRGNDANKKMTNSQSKATNSSNRKPEAAQTLNFQHADDKSLELTLNTKNQLNAILNGIDLQPKNPVNAYTDLGNSALNNPFLLMLMQNQAAMPMNNGFGLGNMNYHDYMRGVSQNKMNIFPQEYNPFQSLMLFPDAVGHLYGQSNPQAFMANPLVNPMCFSMEDIRGGLLQNHLATNSVQENHQNRATINQKNFNGVSHSETQAMNHSAMNHSAMNHSTMNHLATNHLATNHLATNQEASLQKQSVTEDTVEPHSPSNLKAGAEDDTHVKRKRTRTCFNQCCQTDPMNANLWSKVRVMGKMSCKICEDAWKKQQYCYFCKQVYTEDGEGYSDSKSWIDCDICKRWTHTECEEKHIQREIKLQQEKEDGNVEYNCPSCRSKARGPGRKPARRASPFPNESSYPQRIGPERPTHDELEQSGIRKQIKLNPELMEDKEKEPSGNNNSNAILPEETCIAKKKLDNMFNKHIQKRKLQAVRPVIGYNNYAIVDSLLTQYGKKLQLNDNELHHDLHLMREYAGKNSTAEKFNPMEGESPEPSNCDNDGYNIDDGKKSGPRTLRNRGRDANSRRTGRSDINMSENFDEETGSEYLSLNGSKRATRTRR